MDPDVIVLQPPPRKDDEDEDNDTNEEGDQNSINTQPDQEEDSTASDDSALDILDTTVDDDNDDVDKVVDDSNNALESSVVRTAIIELETSSSQGGNNDSHIDHEQKSSKEAMPPKSDKDRHLIRLALHRNPYFTCLDEEQIENFIEAADMRVFQPGEAIILEGCRDDRAAEHEDNEHQEDGMPSTARSSGHSSSTTTYEDNLADADDLLDYEFVDVSNDHKAFGGVQTTLSSQFAADYVPPPLSGSKSYLYILRTGNANVFYDTLNVASLGPGILFGEGGFLFGRQHSASIVAGEPVECWVVDYSTFSEHVLQSDNIKRMFASNAHKRDSKGNLYITMKDFVEATLKITNARDESSEEVAGGVAIAYQTILQAWASSNHSPNRIYLSDFCFFHMLMARPDPEVDIAFLLMDRHKTGSITFADFEAFLSDKLYFDRQSEFVNRHFGQERVIRSFQFSQFLVDLQTELGRQAFLHQVKEAQTDNKHSGILKSKEFINVLKSTCGWRLPDGLVNRLESLYFESAESSPTATVHPLDDRNGASRDQANDNSMRSETTAEMGDQEHRTLTRYFTYLDFLAFQGVLRELPGICNLIERACEIKKGRLSQDDFKVANRILGVGGQLSQRQVDIIFNLFDLDRDGFLSSEDAVSVCGYAYGLQAVPGRDGKYTFAPPPNYPKRGGSGRSDTTEMGTHSEIRPREHIVGRLLNQFTQLMLSSVAGGIGLLAVYPLDLVKTRMMNQRIGADGSRLYLQSFDCLRKTVQFEGFRGLYRGLLPPLLAVGPERTVKFAVYGMLQGLSSKEEEGKKFHWLMEMVRGGCAGACQLLVTNPLEITKIRLQLQGETSRVLSEQGLPIPKQMSFSEVAADLGLSGLYRGAAACVIRDIPFGAIYFPAYTLCKDYLMNQEGASQSAYATQILLAGTLAGVPASLLTTPADMVKTRLQVIPRPGEVAYSGIGDCIKTIYNSEGPTAFFKGSLFRVCRIAPQFGVSLLGYETLSQWVGFKSPRSTPPSNADVKPSDHDTSFPTAAIAAKTNDINKLVRNMGLVKSRSDDSWSKSQERPGR